MTQIKRILETQGMHGWKIKVYGLLFLQTTLLGTTWGQPVAQEIFDDPSHPHPRPPVPLLCFSDFYIQGSHASHPACVPGPKTVIYIGLPFLNNFLGSKINHQQLMAMSRPSANSSQKKVTERMKRSPSVTSEI